MEDSRAGTLQAAENHAGRAAPVYGAVRTDTGARWTSCCIVGSGPSLRGFDFERLRDTTVLAVNDAMLKVPWAAALFSMDHRWVRSRLTSLVEFPGEKYVAIQERFEDLWSIPGVTYLRRARFESLSADSRIVHLGGCSGYGALNVAVLKGATDITLYGFDLTPGRAFDSDQPEQRSQYQTWARMFRSTLPFLRERCIRVLNASEDSAIDAFPRIGC